MEPFFVYMLKCSDNSYYVGQTDNLEKRIAEHKDKKAAGYTSTRLPIEVVFSEQFSSREEAKAAEHQIKGWSRKKKEALIRNDWSTIIKLSNTKKRSCPSTSSG